MHRFLLFLCVSFSVQSLYEATRAGLVELDEHSFDKILNKFDAALVKFDVAYPFGDKHDAFVALALEAKDVDELLVADVNVKDYGEKDNEALALQYGASKENFPVVKLFIKGNKDPIPFVESREFTPKVLREFVQEKTGIRMVLPGCVRRLDTLAGKFMKASSEDRKTVLKDVEEDVKTLPEKHTSSGKMYMMIMKKVIEKGDEFIKAEEQRVKQLLMQKMADEKKKQISNRRNILKSFAIDETKAKQDL